MNNKSRIVIDTNVLISAGLLPQSKTAQALTLAVSHYVIAQNRATWEELETRIERKKFDRYFGEFGRMHYLSKLSQLTHFLPISTRVQMSRDPDDDKFIALAIDSGATIIMSGDPDLTDIKKVKGIEIITPAQFIDRFTSTQYKSI